VKLFVARFWRDCKEWEAVCMNYFAGRFRFGNELDGVWDERANSASVKIRAPVNA